MGREMLPWLPTSQVVRHEFDNLGKLPSIKVPTFVSHGTADRIIPFAMRDRLAKAAGGPVTTFSNGAGHNDFFDVEPERTIEGDAGVPEIAASFRCPLAASAASAFRPTGGKSLAALVANVRRT